MSPHNLKIRELLSGNKNLRPYQSDVGCQKRQWDCQRGLTDIKQGLTSSLITLWNKTIGFHVDKSFLGWNRTQDFSFYLSMGHYSLLDSSSVK